VDGFSPSERETVHSPERTPDKHPTHNKVDGSSPSQRESVHYVGRVGIGDGHGLKVDGSSPSQLESGHYAQWAGTTALSLDAADVGCRKIEVIGGRRTWQCRPGNNGLRLRDSLSEPPPLRRSAAVVKKFARHVR